MRAFVGPKAYYYLSSWSGAMRGHGQAKGFKWPAFLINGIWIPYRKMYRNTFILFGIIVGSSVIEEIGAGAGWITESMVPTLETLDRVAGLAISIVCGMYGNTWYLNHVKRKVAEVRGWASRATPISTRYGGEAEQTSWPRSDYSCFSWPRSSL